MRAGFGIVGAVLLLGLAVALAPPASADHSYGAIYAGSVSSGGEMEFVVSPDGSEVTHFELNAVPTECGTITTEVDGHWPIANHAFTNTAGPVQFTGSFPAVQSAQGTVQYKWSGFPSCTSSVMNWTATTSTPPPATPTPTPSPTTTPTPGPDVIDPEVNLSGKLTQKLGRSVSVNVVSDEAASAVAKGRVKVRAKRYKLGTDAEQLAANVPETLKLSVPRKARAAIKRALGAGRRVTAALSVTVTYAAGNVDTATRSVRIK